MAKLDRRRRGWCAALLSLAVIGCGGPGAPDPANPSELRVRKPRPTPTPTPTPAPAPTPTPAPAPAPAPAPGTARLLWQVALDGAYTNVRPVVGPDGTVYVADVSGTLHAVAPDGTRRWKVAGAGGKGLAVGADGVVYAGSETAVRAFGPDGVARWTFVQNPFAFLFVALAVGPDGNLYAVATNGLGVFSLTPGGALRWAVTELYNTPIVASGEIAFGPGAGGTQLTFYANHHLRSLDLSGRQVFLLNTAGQPVVSPLDGTIHLADRAYRPDGTLLWDSPLGAGSTPAVGPDGASYYVFLGAELDSLDAGGRPRYQVAGTDWLDAPAIDPGGALLVLGVIDPATGAGSVVGRSAADGSPLWRVPLPAGQQADTTSRFSADGSVAYLVATQSTVPQGAWLTAVAVR